MPMCVSPGSGVRRDLPNVVIAQAMTMEKVVSPYFCKSGTRFMIASRVCPPRWNRNDELRLLTRGIFVV